MHGGLSHVLGDTSEPLSELTVDGMFCETVRRTPDRLALSSSAQGIRYSWNELEEQVATAAAGLLNIGVGSGDRVGCWLPNVAEYVVMQLATARIGAILTCLNPAYKLAELQHALRLAGVKALLFSPGGARSDHTAVVERLLQTAEEAAPCLERVVSAVGQCLFTLSLWVGRALSRASHRTLGRRWWALQPRRGEQSAAPDGDGLRRRARGREAQPGPGPHRRVLARRRARGTKPRTGAGAGAVARRRDQHPVHLGRRACLRRPDRHTATSCW